MFTRYPWRRKKIADPMKRTIKKRPKVGKALLLAAFIAAAVVPGTLMLQKYLARHQVAPQPVTPQPAGKVSVSLFFASQDASGLVRESREIDACNAELPKCMLAALEELANGPMGDLAPTIPENSTFRAVQIQGDTAVVDLDNSLVNALPKGSSSEMTAVYSMVNTIAYNFPAVKRVKFLLEGHSVATLGGHLDLKNPLEPDFRLESPKS